MATYHRYQPIYGAQQHLYCEGCPVYVHRYQLSADLQTGGRILQVRMVNMSEWEVRTVFLRIACLDGQGRAISTMYAVPLSGLNAARGSLFGENYTLRLSSSMTQMVQIFPERIVFADGTAWNETETAAYVSLPAPIPVLETDVDFDRLAQQGQRNGVHNDFRYQELEAAWYCTCGLPNARRRQFCGYCGTNREWLRLNMNGRAAIVRHEPEQLQQPPAPEKRQTEVQVPDFSEDISVAQLLDGMNQREDSYSAPVAVMPQQPYSTSEQEFPVIQPLPPQKSSAGKAIGIALLVMAILATAAFSAIRFLLPQLRYSQANDSELMGNYEEARQIFTELGDYADAPQRVTGTWYQQALAQMRDGNYEAAYQIFCTIPNFEDSKRYAGDCIYSLGVLAFNDGDTKTAWDYVLKLHLEFPDYAGGEDLYVSCCYAIGNEAMNAGDYDAAKMQFVLAGDYKNAADLIQYCDYQLACKAREDEDFVLAAEMFGTCTYGDSKQQALDCMMQYVQKQSDRKDEKLIEYLDALCAAEYSGAEELYEELFGWEIDLHVTTDTKYGAAVTDCKQTDDLNKLNIAYSVKGGRVGETVSIVVIYTLPDGTTGNTFLASELSSGTAGNVKWETLKAPACEKEGTAKFKFCNADTGEELYTCSVELKKAES